jgi:hypothetical protein
MRLPPFYMLHKWYNQSDKMKTFITMSYCYSESQSAITAA